MKKVEQKRYKLNLILTLLMFLIILYYPYVNIRAQIEYQDYSWKNVKIVGGGFVPGIIFNQTEKDLIYARTDIGGAYRWDPDNDRWIPLMDWVSSEEWNLLGIESLATDPVDPDRLYVAAGTYTNDWTSMNGYILRSTDRGNTWDRTEMPFKFGGNEPGRSMGERLVVDPNCNNIIYFGTRNNGLWKSTDYGKTWARVESFPAIGNYVVENFSGIGVVWVAFDKNSSEPDSPTRTIYVGVADTNTSIYRSTDAGETWEVVPGQPTGYLPHHGILASNGVLYITYGNTPGPYDITTGDVWKYDTNTETWTNISPVPSSSEDNYFGYGGLAVDASNPDTIMVATMNSWWPDDNIYRSTDGGETWTSLWSWGIYPERELRYNHDISGAPWLDFGKEAVLPEVSPKLGWMIGDLEIDPHNPDRMMYGTGATIYGSENLTNLDKGTKINISVMCEGLEETSVQDLISPPSGAPLVSALGDIGGFRHDDLDKVPSEMFTTPVFSTTSSIDYAELTPNFMVRVGYADTDAEIRRIGFSYDGGENWFQASSEPTGCPGGGVIAASADGSVVVWSGMETAEVSYSTDNGNTWVPSSGIPMEAVVISDRVNPEKFYGYANGSFYLSTDGGVGFSEITTGLPLTGKIKAVPGREGDIWLTGNEEGLWHSTDGGVTFTKLVNVEEAEAVGFGKAAPDHDYMAIYLVGIIEGVHGVYRSIDAGETWVRINDDKHQYGWIGKCITGDPGVYGRVYLATNGRGIIYGEPGYSIPILPGDVNGDHSVSAVDYTYLQRFLLGVIDDFPVETGKEAADMNNDGQIGSLDFTQLRRVILFGW